MKKNKINIFKEQVQIIHLDSVADLDFLFNKIKENDMLVGNFFDGDIKEKIKYIMQNFEFPITVIYEPYYVDRVYRDEYYSYYSKKHFNISKNARRMTFINRFYDKKDLLCNDKEMFKTLEDDLIGMVVIKPTRTIGRTLLKPSKMKIPRCYIRTTKFEMSVYGNEFLFYAFPFSGQDSEVMTCAEVNIWQIMEYFGTRYKDYKTLLPSELIDLVKANSDTRILPSDGLTVEQESSLFMKNGLSPLIYYRYLEYLSEDIYRVIEQYKNPTYIEILHLYIESGIPVLINLREKDNPQGENHSITCIGHEYIEASKVIERMERVELVIDKKELDKEINAKYNRISILKSWSGYDKYVLMEDHSVPYQVKSFDDLMFDGFQKGTYWEIESFVAPLYKHVFMPAEDAYEIALVQIKDNFEDICNNIGNDMQHEVPQIIIRMYLASSKSFKNYRIKNALSTSLEGLSERLFYSQVNYPKFLWVCEYSTMEQYANHQANGEIVFDATSAKDYSVISIRHGEVITYRAPDDVEDNAYKPMDLRLSKTFTTYESNNLKDSKYD